MTRRRAVPTAFYNRQINCLKSILLASLVCGAWIDARVEAAGTTAATNNKIATDQSSSSSGGTASATDGATATSGKAHQHVHTDSFPTYDEYDINILDPNSAFGTPFGGFGRATSSRIASLPLLLPHVSMELDDFTSLMPAVHTKIRDSQGRLFVCRVYHEDEIEPDTLTDSVFDTPKHRIPGKDYNKVTEPSTTSKVKNTSPKDITLNPQLAQQALINAAQELADKMVNNIDADPMLIKTQNEIDTIKQLTQKVMEGVSVKIEKFTVNADGSIEHFEWSTDEDEDGEGVEGGTETATAKKPNTKSDRKKKKKIRPKVEKDDIEKKLSSLDGLCGHVHLGWWSYEWCYMSHVSQFHLEVLPPGTDDTADASSASETKKTATIDYSGSSSSVSKVKITDPTKLGSFKARNIMTDLTGTDPNPLALDLPELARVTEIHVDGDICDATKKPRTTEVNMICCSPKILERTNKAGKMLRLEDNEIVKDDEHYATVFMVKESKTAICTYTLTVCTPMLCGDEEEEYEDDAVEDEAGGVKGAKDRKVVGAPSTKKDSDDDSTIASPAGSRKLASSDLTSVGPKENESVREILERTLGEHCLQANTGGWWTYEFCHGGKVRQYHEVLGSKKTAAGTTYTSRIIESEHLLGEYQQIESESFPDEEEWKHVTNVTTSSSSTSGPSSSASQAASSTKGNRGNGAYFELEYKGGDVCDHSDVTDSAVVAGSTNQEKTKKRGIERAASVRYYCGDVYFVDVSEDSTCHYVVEVLVPDLCEHPLFKAPVKKKQVFKCLPVDDEDDDFILNYKSMPATSL